MVDIWTNLIESLADAPDGLVAKTWFPDDHLSALEIYMQLAASASQGYLHSIFQDPDYPEFAPICSRAYNLAAPVADYMYHTCPINGEGTYRLFGYRGTCRFVEIAMYRDLSKATDGGKGMSRTAGTINLDDCTIGENGWFEVLLSAERPEAYDGDWFYMEPIVDSLLARAAAYDWLNEDDAKLGIERVDVPMVRPRVSAAQLEAKFAKYTALLKPTVEIWLDHINRQREAGAENELRRFDFLSVGGLPGQDYFEGVYNLAEGEALVIETDVPSECRYWSILVTDDKFGTVDWANHQSSLNGHQARIDDDGKFRCVVSLTDPGVSNWLDTGGYTTGLLQLRWNNANSSPEPVARKVRLVDLRDHLPAATPAMSVAERDEQLRTRRRGALMRRRW